MQHANSIGIGEGCGAAGQAQSLHDIDGPNQPEIPRMIDLADDKHSISTGGFNLNGHHGIGYEFPHSRLELGT